MGYYCQPLLFNSTDEADELDSKCFSVLHQLLLLFCCILPFVQSGNKQKKKRDMFIHTVDDDKYETLLLLVKGKFHVPVAERTRSQKSAVVQFWRRKELFTLGNE